MKGTGPSSGVSAALEMGARAGYAARGFVYLSIGLLALSAALQITASPSGTRGAIAALSQWPFARVWLTAVALGLASFAGWRALQSLIDADRQGKSWAALASRAGQAISGLVYGSLAWSTFRLLDRIREIHTPEEEASARAGASRIRGPVKTGIKREQYKQKSHRVGAHVAVHLDVAPCEGIGGRGQEG